MPNYKSDNLTFLTIAEMTSMQVDSTDQDGLLFAVATDSTTFKMVMWRKTSSATIDNELVYPANGPGRWHVLPVGEVNTKEVLIVEGNTLPSTISGDIDLIALKKTDGKKELKAKFGGVFEDLLGAGGLDVAYYSLNTGLEEHLNFSSIPEPADKTSFSLAIVDVYREGYSGTEHDYYLYCWIPRSESYLSKYTLLSHREAHYWESESDFSDNQGIRAGEIRPRERLAVEGDQPYDGYADWFIWDGGSWIALITKDNANSFSGYYTRPLVNNFGMVIGGSDLRVLDIPSLPASKITSEVFNIARLPVGTTSTTVARGDHTHVVSFSTLSGVGLSTPATGQVLGFNGFIWTNVNAPSGTVTLTGDITGTGTGDIATTLANIGTAGTYVKVTTDAKGRVLSGSSLIASDIPLLDAGKITTGIFDITRIPDLNTAKITSGTFDISFIPTGSTSTTVALGNHNHTFSSLSDVSITSLSNGQILSFDSATSQWKNTTLPSGTGAVNSVDGAFGDVILTNTYQAKSNELTAIAGLTDTVGYIKKTGDGTYILDNNISGGVSSINGLTGAISLDTTYQPLSNELTAISSLADTTGYIKKTGDGTYILDNSVSGGVTSIDGLTGVVSLANTYQTKSNELTALTNLADTVGFIKKTADGAYVIEDIAGGVSGVTSVDGLTGAVILSDKYLALSGGTVPGITNFTSNTPSTSTTTGAVKISNGGLAVTGSGYFGGDLSHNGYLKKNGLGSAGWTAMTGTADLSTAIDTSTTTLIQLAQRVKGIQDTLASLGILDDTGSDPYSSSIILYLKGEGINGGTTFTDDAVVPKTVTRTGTVTTSTSQFRTGMASLSFPGTTSYLDVALGVDTINIRTDIFTMETWVRITSQHNFCFFGSSTDSLYLQYNAGTWYLGDGSNNNIITTNNLALSTWSHVALSFDGGTYRLFKDGVQIGSSSSLLASNTISTLRIGARTSQAMFLAGNLDSIRITKGIARYTADFNPLTNTYLN